ncbi:O-acetyl-ADP-ribose deacetylase [Spongiimicrobium salis]|uniref:O-acetyl-ADP-ribose deacetylase n=1 Tax=Spongiimicrobium salis TaxID=1667022 RepID=UPI00374D11A3
MKPCAKIELIQADITQLEIEAIVNAANTSLLGGGGVDGAIHKAGGKQILEDCIKIRNRQGGCKVGEAVLTSAGNLNAKYVIHTVGPRWNNGQSNEAEKLMDCYINCLKIADEYEIKSIAFPNISTGIYNYPKKSAAKIAIETIRSRESTLEKIVFVCFDEENYSIYKNELRKNEV